MGTKINANIETDTMISINVKPLLLKKSLLYGGVSPILILPVAIDTIT